MRFGGCRRGVTLRWERNRFAHRRGEPDAPRCEAAMTAWRSAEIELSAGGVIFRGDGGHQVLLIKDSYGNWGFPKGHIEPGESALEAAVRECQEETGIRRLEVRVPVGSTDWYFRQGDSVIHKFCDYFLMEAADGQGVSAQTAEGVQACVWMRPEEAMSRVSYENARRVLEKALELYPRG